MSLRTRVFARLLKLTEKGIEEVQDLPRARAQRAALQRGPVGRIIFGTPDRRADVEQIQIEGHRTLVYRPKGVQGPLPCVINFHGGGWVQGNPEQSQWLSSRVAVRNRCVVVAPTYGLGPEQPFPQAVDDARAIVQHVAAHAAELGVSESRIAVMGDSAGGNLAAVTALDARDGGGPELRAQVLIYPGTEMYDRFPSEDEHENAAVLTSANMRAFARLYLGESYGTEDHRASPLRAASHAGLPKTFILTAEIDPLKDNGVRYRDKLEAAGVPVRYAEYPGALHGFISLPGPVPIAAEALDDIVDFLGQTL